MVKKKKQLIMWGCVFLLFIILLGGMYLIFQREASETMLQSDEKSPTKADEQPVEPKQPAVVLQSVENYFDIRNTEEQIPNSTELIGFEGTKVFYYVMKEPEPEQLIFEYYSYDVNSKENTLLYTIDKYVTILGNGVFEGKLFVIEYESDGLLIKLLPSSEEEILFQCQAKFMPEADYEDGKIIISYEMQEGITVAEKIIAVSLLDGSVETIEEKEYEIIDEVFYKGVLLTGIKATKDGVIYQQITYDEEKPYLDESGKSEIIYYSYEDAGKETVLESPYKISYVGGDINHLILTKHSYAMPLSGTGKLYVKEDNGYAECEIPGIASVNDIKWSYVTSEVMVIQSYNDTYIIDLETMNFEKVSDTKGACCTDHRLLITGNNGEILIVDLSS